MFRVFLGGDQLLYPYHMHQAQALLSADCPQQGMFCGWYFPTVYFCGQSRILMKSSCELSQQAQWADGNQHAISQSQHQRYLFNVWVGIMLPGSIQPREYN
jgi:hypothetical protein